MPRGRGHLFGIFASLKETKIATAQELCYEWLCTVISHRTHVVHSPRREATGYGKAAWVWKLKRLNVNPSFDTLAMQH